MLANFHMCGIMLVLRAVFNMFMKNASLRLQTTQPTSGGAVTVDSSCCANCVEPPLDGWRCCSQKRVMSRPIQVRQL